MQYKKISAVIALLLLLEACYPAPTALNHSPSLAREQAQTFADVAFVERNFSKAYGLLSETAKSSFSEKQFKEFMVKKNGLPFPLFVSATDYEPVPGQRKMLIYIYGENDSQAFYYRLTMVGLQETGYKVEGFDLSNRTFPQTNLRHPFGTK